MRTRDGDELGTVAEVLENEAEHIFDGIVVTTVQGERFVDAPEIARITEALVTLSIDAAEAASLPERDPKGAPEFKANVKRKFGRAWKRR